MHRDDQRRLGREGVSRPTETSSDLPRTETLSAGINETGRLTGFSRSELYRLLADGKLRAVKSGSRTLILMESVRQYLASLPAATFRVPRGRS